MGWPAIRHPFEFPSTGLIDATKKSYARFQMHSYRGYKDMFTGLFEDFALFLEDKTAVNNTLLLNKFKRYSVGCLVMTDG